jgi:hypothetical protein
LKLYHQNICFIHLFIYLLYVFLMQNPKAGKIRTESGVWIPATYKTKRYSQWKEKHKIASFQNDDDDDDGGGGNSEVLSQMQKRKFHKE